MVVARQDVMVVVMVSKSGGARGWGWGRCRHVSKKGKRGRCWKGQGKTKGVDRGGGCRVSKGKGGGRRGRQGQGMTGRSRMGWKGRRQGQGVSRSGRRMGRGRSHKQKTRSSRRRRGHPTHSRRRHTPLLPLLILTVHNLHHPALPPPHRHRPGTPRRPRNLTQRQHRHIIPCEQRRLTIELVGGRDGALALLLLGLNLGLGEVVLVLVLDVLIFIINGLGFGNLGGAALARGLGLLGRRLLAGGAVGGRLLGRGVVRLEEALVAFGAGGGLVSLSCAGMGWGLTRPPWRQSPSRWRRLGSQPVDGGSATYVGLRVIGGSDGPFRRWSS